MSDRVIADFELTTNDKTSGLWLRLTAHLEARLAALRVRNDNAALSDIETAALRGEIRALKTLLRLREDRLIFSQD